VALGACDPRAPHRFAFAIDAATAPAYPSAYIFAPDAGAKAQAMQSDVDSALGLVDGGLAGTPVGLGTHAPPWQAITTSYAWPMQNPNTGQWAYLADGVTTAIVAPNAVTLGLPAPVALDATWYADGGAVLVVSDAGAVDGGVVSLDSGVVGSDSGSHATPF
jgi:hypothetical protein